MYDKEKKFRKSAVTVICFVLAAAMLIYACYQAGTTIKQINEYYAQYGMKATPIEYITYVLQSTMATLINAIVLFMLAAIHLEVRKGNPANYLSDEDIIQAAEEKKAAKDAKQFEKGEKAAAKGAEKSEKKASAKAAGEEPVVADFASGDEAADAEAAKTPAAKKPAAKKTAAKKPAAKKPAAKKSGDDKDAPKKAAAKKAAPKRKPASKKTDEEKPEQEKTEE